MRFCLAAALAAALAPNPAQAIVNPALQPAHLWERHEWVLSASLESVDETARTFTLKLVAVHKGALRPEKIVVKVAAGLDEPFDALETGQTVVAFAGKQRRGHEADLLFYTGRGAWHEGALEDPRTGNIWSWVKEPDENDAPAMAGTFNGHEQRLSDLLRDQAAGRAFFPALPYVQFKKEMKLAALTKPAGGVAMYDINGDGLPDVYACSPTGGKALLQRQGLVFEDATDALGLSGLSGTSCSFADVNGDGRGDLLVDAQVRLWRGGKFEAVDLLPARAGEKLKCSTFADINNDGWPDVVVSHAGAGLAVYLNDGSGRSFSDATAAAGLDDKRCAPEGDGYFACGDWNGDGRTDIFYGVGNGVWLIQDSKGRFSPLKHSIELGFPRAGAGPTGCGTFASLLRPAGLDLIVPLDSELRLITGSTGEPTDASSDANELSETGYKQLLTLAEDLNADGNVDLLTASWDIRQPASLHLNRGYGSFMRAEKYKSDVFPGTAHARGCGGLAAGDVDGDGAVDLLMGGSDGGIWLLLNDTLSMRKPSDKPSWHERKLLESSRLRARLSARTGLMGAVATLLDASGRVVARRDVGQNNLTGCRGPDELSLVAREAGLHKLAVRYSDGKTMAWDVELPASKLVVLHADRDAPSTHPTQ
jgi:hypothetical protein